MKTTILLSLKKPCPTTRESILKKISKNTPGMPIRLLPYPTKRGDENLSVVAFDAFSIIKEEVQNPMLWFQKNLAISPQSKWGNMYQYTMMIVE